jgi:hypothetical protein
VEDEDAAARYLHTPSYIRMIFVNKRAAVAFTWSPTRSESSSTSAASSGLLGRLLPPWLWTILPPVGPRFPRRLWTQRCSLSHANMFAPSVPLLPSVASLLYTNFELFVETDVTPHLLLRLIETLQHLLLTRVSGRCEIRGENTSVIYLDFALFLLRCDPQVVVDAVRGVVGPRARMTCHKGKFQVKTG